MIAEPNRLSTKSVESISEKRESLYHSQADLISWQQKLRSALVNAITPEDMTTIVLKQVEKAKQGDEKAAKFLVSQIVNGGPGVSLHQTNIVTDPATAARIAKGKD